jgi:hypothetical protein
MKTYDELISDMKIVAEKNRKNETKFAITDISRSTSSFAASQLVEMMRYTSVKRSHLERFIDYFSKSYTVYDLETWEVAQLLHQYSIENNKLKLDGKYHYIEFVINTSYDEYKQLESANPTRNCSPSRGWKFIVWDNIPAREQWAKVIINEAKIDLPVKTVEKIVEVEKVVEKIIFVKEPRKWRNKYFALLKKIEKRENNNS